MALTEEEDANSHRLSVDIFIVGGALLINLAGQTNTFRCLRPPILSFSSQASLSTPSLLPLPRQMNPEEENNPNLPPKTAASSGTTPLVSQSQPFPSVPFAMDDLSFSASPFAPLFPPPSVELKALIAPPTTSCCDVAGEENLELDIPRPMECLQGSLVPPFFSKPYDLVDDPTLDPIISRGPRGESFVVWDPLDFFRIVLPRNFKHSNFSSFVRQLNTSGFRKIDTDKWEFANEAFRPGERKLLKNIRRHKSPQSQQVGVYTRPSAEAGKFGMEDEVERLKERSMMMQEVVELQQQHQGTVKHMGEVNRRLQAAEKGRKKMLSFLAKLFQNPEFLARLRQQKEQGHISSSRMRRFVSHQQHEAGISESSMEGQIVKYSPDWVDLTLSSEVPDVYLVIVNLTPDYALQDTGLVGEGMLFQIENVAFNELAISDVLAKAQGLINTNTTELAGQGTSSLGMEDSQVKGKNVITPEQEIGPEYFVSFPEDFSLKKDFPEFSSPGIESMVKQENMWNQGMDAWMGMSGSSSELWGNVINYDVPELGSAVFSDIWDLNSVQAAGGSGTAKWPSDENPVDEPENQAGQSKDNRSQNLDP